MAARPRADLTAPRAPRHPVLLHGFTGSAATWGPVVDGLAGAGHVPVAVDLPGHGRHAGENDPSRFTLDATLDRIEEAGRWPADLVGYSMGGRLALHFALGRPGRVGRLVLESASPGIEEPTARAERRASDEALARRIERDGIEAFVDAWTSRPVFATQERLPEEVRAAVRQRRLGNASASLAASLRGVGTGVLPSLWGRLTELRVPTLLLCGSEDRKFVQIAERMADRLPFARLVVVPGCGHRIHLERPDRWVEAVVSFLEDRG